MNREHTRRENVVMATAKKTVKPVAVATPAAEKKVEAPAAEVKAEVKAEKPVAVKKEAVKKEPVKKEAVKKAPAKKAPAKKAPAKKAPAKKVELKTELTVQYAGKSYSQEELVKIAKDVWKYDLKQKVSELTEIELYVKPEEHATYYVMNKKFTGSFTI